MKWRWSICPIPTTVKGWIDQAKIFHTQKMHILSLHQGWIAPRHISHLALTTILMPWMWTPSPCPNSPQSSRLSAWKKDDALGAGRLGTMLEIAALLPLLKTRPLSPVPSMLESPTLSLNRPGIPSPLPCTLPSMNTLIPSRPQEKVSPTSSKFSPPVSKNPLKRSLRSPLLELWIFKQGSHLNVFFPFDQSCTCSTPQQ